MLKRVLPLLTALALGCRGPEVDVPRAVEWNVHDVAPVRATLEEVTPCAATLPAPGGPPRLDLPTLWAMTLVNNPTLRESAADVEAARGRLVQAGLYPNPRFHYTQDTIGSSLARQGNLNFELNQEVVTAGKRRLDQAVADREMSAAAVGLVGRKFATLTLVRRAYYDYLGLRYLHELNGETVATLERGVEVTRQQVEKAKTRPQTDLIRLEALLAEAKITQARTEDLVRGAWGQLAAEIGVSDLPASAEVQALPDALPGWDADGVLRRVLSTNTALKQASVEVERARLVVERARAGAVPNVLVGAGVNFDNTDQTRGGVISVETPLPLWDRQQGRIHEAQARFASAQAGVRSAETRLSRDTAEAFARYKAASRQVERLGAEVLPRLRESLELLRKAYQAGSAQVAFSDVLMTEQNLLTSRATLAEARRSMWLAVADLEGLMQLDVGEECPPTGGGPPRPNGLPAAPVQKK